MKAAAKPKTVTKLLEEVSSKSGRRPSEAFQAFMLLAACCVSCGQREDEYLAEAKRWDAPCLELFSHALGALVEEMEAHPFEDRLGPTYMEVSALGDLQHKGAFYTPPALCRMCAEMTIGYEFPDGPITVDEPACGSGGMMLACAAVLKDRGVAVSRMRVRCTDVDYCACNMCLINLTLWGIPGEVVHGNALSLDEWHRWQTPMWLRWPNLMLGDGAASDQPKQPEAPAIVIGRRTDGQLFMDWEAVA